jgi:hypothetical protein
LIILSGKLPENLHFRSIENVTISFLNLSHMAYFIIECGISDFTPDWKNAALTGNLENSHIYTALVHYDAYITKGDTTIASA